MSLFRSEEHVRRWLAANGYKLGAIVDLPTVWRLAKAWYGDPRAPDWRPRMRDESQAVLASVGLTGDFWELPR
jgi:Alkylmercury lyase